MNQDGLQDAAYESGAIFLVCASDLAKHAAHGEHNGGEQREQHDENHLERRGEGIVGTVNNHLRKKRGATHIHAHDCLLKVRLELRHVEREIAIIDSSRDGGRSN